MSQVKKPSIQPIFIPANEPLPIMSGRGTEIPSLVLLFNDDVHSFEDVIIQLMKAVGCSALIGYLYALEVHTIGRATVFLGPMIRCLTIAEVLREIDLKVEVRPMM